MLVLKYFKIFSGKMLHKVGYSHNKEICEDSTLYIIDQLC